MLLVNGNMETIVSRKMARAVSTYSALFSGTFKFHSCEHLVPLFEEKAA